MSCHPSYCEQVSVAGQGARLTVFLILFGLLAGAAWLSVPVHAQTVSHGVAAAAINVVQHNNENTTAAVTVTTTVSVNDFRIRAGSNRGDFNVQIGEGFSDDVESGVLITCVAENGRNNGEAAYPGVNFCTTAIDYSRGGATAGAFYIPVFQAPTGDEFNINVAAAFFSYSDWIGGFARNSEGTTGGANNLFSGSPGLAPGTHFIDHGGGRSTVNLTGLGIDSRTSGVLLVTHGRNEDNFALSQVNSDGTWTLYVKDNGTDAATYEQDPVAFVFVPKTNTTVVSGRFRGDGAVLIHSGTTPQFTVANIGTGRWRLTIPGHSPKSGVLIISAEGGLTQNRDNIVSYQPDGDTWIIQSRDLPASPPPLETPGNEPVASFVFIPVAADVKLSSPPDNSESFGSTATLRVNVTNHVPGNLTVNFYGRRATANHARDFAIVLMPDTQYYASSRNGGVPAMWYAQSEWIITNRVARNIAYVAHLGDIVQSGDLIGSSPNLTEWRVATNAMYRIESPARTQLPHGIPYGMAVGNHDQEPIGDPSGTTFFFNQYFGVPHFTGRSYYAGHYGTNNNNHFDFFTAGGMDFIVLYFEYDTGANPAVLAWANAVLQTNAHRRAIIVTHYLGNTQTPLSFGAQGAAIYNALKKHSNIFMMLGGHITGEGSRVDTFNGNVIRSFVSDYQGWTNGGNGFMRIIDFSPKNNQVIFTTYSPWTDEYNTGPASEFYFTYDMQQPPDATLGEFELIGTVSNVAPGGTAGITWPARQAKAAYQWYVSVADALGNTTVSPMWRFVTVTNSAPSVSNRLATVTGDAPVPITLTAIDPDGDALTFQTHSVPTRGLLMDFNPASGTMTYVPARGFRGLDRFTFSASDGQDSSSIATLNLNVISPPDTNGNGLPDAWEAAFNVTNPNADDDGDGMTNLEEYFANTNPTNAASALRVGSVHRHTNGHVTVTWPSVGGTRYRVQFSNGSSGGVNGAFTDLVRPLNLEMDPAPYGAQSVQSFIDDFTQIGGSATNTGRYYRVKVVP